MAATAFAGDFGMGSDNCNVVVTAIDALASIFLIFGMVGVGLVVGIAVENYVCFESRWPRFRR